MFLNFAFLAYQKTPSKADQLFQEGNQFLGEGKLNRAIDLYTQAIKADSRHVNAFANRGLAYSNLLDFEQAIKDYTKALTLGKQNENPELPLLYINRGYAYANHDDQFEKAIDDYTSALKIEPEYAPAYCNRGLINQKLERFERAIFDYQLAVQYSEGTDVAEVARQLLDELEIKVHGEKRTNAEE